MLWCMSRGGIGEMDTRRFVTDARVWGVILCCGLMASAISGCARSTGGAGAAKGKQKDVYLTTVPDGALCYVKSNVQDASGRTNITTPGTFPVVPERGSVISVYCQKDGMIGETHVLCEPRFHVDKNCPNMIYVDLIDRSVAEIDYRQVVESIKNSGSVLDIHVAKQKGIKYVRDWPRRKNTHANPELLLVQRENIVDARNNDFVWKKAIAPVNFFVQRTVDIPQGISPDLLDNHAMEKIAQNVINASEGDSYNTVHDDVAITIAGLLKSTQALTLLIDNNTRTESWRMNINFLKRQVTLDTPAVLPARYNPMTGGCELDVTLARRDAFGGSYYVASMSEYEFQCD